MATQKGFNIFVKTVEELEGYFKIIKDNMLDSVQLSVPQPHTEFFLKMKQLSKIVKLLKTKNAMVSFYFESPLTND